MNITQVYAVYFSATGNTRKVTTCLLYTSDAADEL